MSLFPPRVDLDPAPCLGPDLFVLKSLANDCKGGHVSSNVSRRVLGGFLPDTNAGPGAPPPSGLPPQPTVRTHSHQGPQCEATPTAIEPISGTNGRDTKQGRQTGLAKARHRSALNFKGQTQRDRGEIGFFPLLKEITHDAGCGEKKEIYQLKSAGDFPAGSWSLWTSN